MYIVILESWRSRDSIFIYGIEHIGFKYELKLEGWILKLNKHFCFQALPFGGKMNKPFFLDT